MKFEHYNRISRHNALEMGRQQWPGDVVTLREPLIPLWLWPRRIDWLARLEHRPKVAPNREAGGITYGAVDMKGRILPEVEEQAK